MRYLSLFSGIEAASVAWRPLGWQPVAFAEIDPFACAALAYHYPDVPNLGDVTKITDQQVAALGTIDIVIGGSPCQDLSVAGRRVGLAGERSGLFHEQVRIFHAARKYCGARFLVWENVPGAFTSNKGRDFAVVVGALAGLDPASEEQKWGNEGVALGEHGLLEWGVLDAQWFGVAQRRRRVFAVLDTGDWRNRPPILLEPESLRGDPPTRGEAGKDAADRIGFSVTGSVTQRYGAKLGTDESCSGSVIPSVSHCLNAGGLAARLLTPRECERLQGFPDDYTRIPQREYARKRITALRPPDRWEPLPNGHWMLMSADGPRHKALGNSMAVPVMRWIGRRIVRAYYAR